MLARFKIHWPYIFAALIAFLTSWVIDGWDYFSNDQPAALYKFKHGISVREDELNGIINNAMETPVDTPAFDNYAAAYNGNFSKLYSQQQAGLFIYYNDTLVYWTDGSIPVDRDLYYTGYKNKIVKLKSGWYQSAYRTQGKLTFWALGLVKHSFPYQNNYLSNDFQNSFDLPAEVGIKLIQPTNLADYEIPGKTVDNYQLVYPDTFRPSLTVRYISIALYILGWLLLVVYFERAFSSMHRGKHAVFYALGFLVLIVGVRYLSFKLRFPENLHSLELFSPLLYAESEWLPSLGDLLFNALTFFYAIYFFSRYVTLTRYKEKIPQWLRFGLSVAMFSIIFFLAPFIFSILQGLVNNSNISFNINNLFSLTTYSYLAFVVFGVLLFSLFILADKLLGVVVYYGKTLRFSLSAFTAAASIYILALNITGVDDLVNTLFIFLITGIILYNKLGRRLRYEFTTALVMILLFGLFSTYIISSNVIAKEKKNRELMVSRLAAETDPILEFLFEEVDAKIQSDSILHSYLLPNSEAADNKQFKDLNQLYFNGYWEKYDIKVAFFGEDNCPMRVLNTSTHHDPIYFETLIRESSRSTQSENFYFLNNLTGRISYLAKLKLSKLYKGAEYSGTLYLEFESKYNLEEVGYPELLLDRKVKANIDLTDYSYARYKNGQLTGQYGKYPYSLSAKVFGNVKEEYNWQNIEGYTHLIDRTGPDTLVVLSRRAPGFIDAITPFSYFFFFYGILVFIYYLITRLRVHKPRFKLWPLVALDFKGRIQVTVISILLVSLIIIGGGTIFYVVYQNDAKNNEFISEKIHSISTELQNRIGANSSISPYSYDELSFMFSRMSNVFYTDINMYDLNGKLIASSRPVIFEEGLSSKNIDPSALLELRLKQRTEYIHNENIGELKYTSAYVPFRNYDNKLLGYINVPYFAKQSELRKEITTVLVAIVNIYVLLIGVSLTFALLISTRITRPLGLIQEKMARLRLGRSNEYIDYKSNDEIGRLVAEYNRMISELGHSADLLAKSERESAWKEMAKQVAHEIKNPLTPMKLSVQQLQRTYQPNSPEWEAQLKRFTQSLIEQIDTLSRIAGEFATFARMPKTEAAPVDLYELLVNVQQLHANDSGFSIAFKPDTIPPCMVVADKEQLLRVFNNLVKNASQAIPEDREGRITLGIAKRGKMYIATVSDNGTGIPDDLHDKIFTPSFTTKTSGMGLGLAIVKGIIESAGGNIYFESREAIGCTFYVELPAMGN